ncbi:hypothetical protein DPMN_126281 [Dreissena polymorpha]|uniref:GINS complex subunit 2 n=1 Tax=Dreissena polymorpha TaxID=45954 RepID=A0A9D4GZ84_DREPO|nr:hypothetical protein DPMN_126281 [Dreissena polymorpha]
MQRVKKQDSASIVTPAVLLFFRSAVDDIPHADETRTLIKDIWDLRMAKLRSSIDTFVKSDATHAKLNHLTLMELNTVRPFLTKALDQLNVLRSNTGPGAQYTQD